MVTVTIKTGGYRKARGGFQSFKLSSRYLWLQNGLEKNNSSTLEKAKAPRISIRRRFAR